MEPQSATDEEYRQKVDQAIQHHQDDELEKCLALARDLLQDDRMPRYYRIKVLLHLAYTVGNREEANSHRVEAEALWRATKHWHPDGQNERVDVAMNQLRQELDEVTKVLDKELFVDDEELEAAVQEQEAKLQREAEEKKEHEEVLDETSAEVLGMSVQQMRDFTESKKAPKAVPHTVDESDPEFLACGKDWEDLQKRLIQDDLIGKPVVKAKLGQLAGALSRRQCVRYRSMKMEMDDIVRSVKGDTTDQS